jgi:hypothetical protein
MGGDVMEYQAQLGIVMVAFAFLVILVTLLLFAMIYKLFNKLFAKPCKPKQPEDVMFRQLSAENQAKYLYWLIVHENDD